MRPKTPNSCPDCGARTLNLVSVTSRIYTVWKCSCGLSWRADASTGRLITRLTELELQQATAGS